MKVVITGGHHSSALPVIKTLLESFPVRRFTGLGISSPPWEIEILQLEFHEITALGIPFYHIWAGKFYRTLNLTRLAKIPYGFIQCLGLLSKLKPDVILSFGGYIAVPTVLAGWVLGIPSITHEQTVVAGWANRLVSKIAKKVLISWKESAKYFPQEKTVFVGLPLRKEIFEVRSQNFLFENDLPVVYVTTGKIGSHLINQLVKGCLKDLLKICNVIHQCGDNSVFSDFDKLAEEYILVSKGSSDGVGRYYLRKFVFENEIGEAYGKSHLVVSRSGAHTTAELLTLRKRCLLIPIPWVSHHEQFENAKILVDAGFGTILPEKDLSPEKLLNEIKNMLEKGFESQSSKISEQGAETVSDPAKKIVDQLMRVVKKS